MAGVSWKMAVLVAVMVIFTVLEYQMVDAQTSLCGTYQCAAHAYCDNPLVGSNYCRCRSGYKGDGILGSGYKGCKKHRLIWKIIVGVVCAVIAALLLLCLCLACLKHCLTRRKRNRGPVVQQQQGYTQTGVPLGAYENNNFQKVPGPVGAV